MLTSNSPDFKLIQENVCPERPSYIQRKGAEGCQSGVVPPELLFDNFELKNVRNSKRFVLVCDLKFCWHGRVVVFVCGRVSLTFVRTYVFLYEFGVGLV